jgi:hypothetical protein
VTISNIIRIVDSQNRNTQWPLFGAGMGVLAVGLSGLFWLNNEVIEVMTLGNLFVSLTVYLAIKWIINGSKNDKYLYLTSIVYGLGVSHLQSIILLGPGLLYLFVSQVLTQKIISVRKIFQKITIILGICLISFTIGSASIIPLNAHQQEFAWDFPQTLSGWWGMVTRVDYQGVFADKGINVENSYVGSINLDRTRAIPVYLVTLWNQFAGPLVVITIIGAVYLYKKNKHITIGLLLLYLVAGLLFGSFVTITDERLESLDYRLGVGIAHRQYLIGITLLGLFSGLGGYGMQIIMRTIFKTNRYKNISSLLIGILPLISLLIANWGIGYQRNNSFSSEYNKSLLQSAEPNSVIICTSDLSCFGLYYKSLVENIRPDVTILSKITRARHFFLNKHIEFVGYEYGENPFFFAQEISWNVAHRPTYITSLESFYVKYMGLDGAPFYVTPHGYLFKIETSFPQKIEALNDEELAKKLLSSTIDSRDFVHLGLLDYFANNFQVRAQLYTKYRDYNNALRSLNYAISFNSQDQRILDWLTNLDIYMDASSYLNTPTIPRFDYLLEAKNQYKNGNLEKAYESARIASYLNPLSPEPLLLQKELLIKKGYQKYANYMDAHLVSLNRILMN